MIFPPLLDPSHLLGEVRVTLGHLELNGDGVLCARLELLRVFVVILLEEGSDHDNIVHAQKVGIESRLQGIILGNIVLPILCSFGGLHFENSVNLPVFSLREIVPHTAEVGAVGEEITPSLIEVILPPNIGRSDNVHCIGLLHVCRLFRFDGLTSDGVDRVLERLLVCFRDSAPHFKCGRPRVQTENGGKPSTRDFLRFLGRSNLNTIALKPFDSRHYSSPPSPSISLIRLISSSQSDLEITVNPSV